MPESIVWRRPEEIFESKPYGVFQNSIAPQDIKQGKLGDCYFLSALASISLSTVILKRVM
jgi:calpain-15